ncbi:MAG: hypothetical protein HYS13_07630 [Planctomycetia bacterium]|nr:hypothetical protein [Planctomycetia bacterium]
MSAGRMRGLFAVFVLALGLRAAAVFVTQSYVDPFAYEHGEIAENLAAGRGFSVRFLGADGPTSQQAPAYPILLAGAYRLFGPGTSGAFLTIQLAQCVAGAGCCLAVIWLAWSLFPARAWVGWLAGLAAAIHPTHIYAATQIQVAVWATTLLALVLAMALSSAGRSRGGWRAGMIGIAIGLLMLFEPILALAAPIVALAFWLAKRKRLPALDGSRTGRPLLHVACMAACVVAVVAPWIARNYAVHGQFVFIKSTFGYAFWQGNNEISWGTDKVPKASAERLRTAHDGSLASMARAMRAARDETIYIDDVLLKPGGYRELAGLNEPQRAALLGQKAWEFVRANPGRYFGLCVQRLRFFLLFDETNPKASNLLYRATTVLWLAAFSLGFVLTLRDGRRLWPVYATIAAVALFHTLTIVSVRFRIPLEPLTLPICAAGIVQSIWWARRKVTRNSSATHAAISLPPGGGGLWGGDGRVKHRFRFR